MPTVALGDVAMSLNSPRGPSGASLGALFGLLVVMFMTARPRFYPSDVDVLIDMLWIIGSAAIGGMTGALIARITRRAE